RFAHENLSRCGDTAQPRTRVRSISNDGVAQGFGATDITGHQWPGMDADAYRQRWPVLFDALAVEGPQHIHLFERAADTAQSVVWVRHWGTPERHDPVSHELVEGAFILEQGFDHLFEVVVEHFDDHFGAGFLAHR